jgi:hypothetical protein
MPAYLVDRLKDSAANNKTRTRTSEAANRSFSSKKLITHRRLTPMIFPRKRTAEKQQRICRKRCETAEETRQVMTRSSSTPWNNDCTIQKRIFFLCVTEIILQSRTGRTTRSWTHYPFWWKHHSTRGESYVLNTYYIYFIQKLCKVVFGSTYGTGINTIPHRAIKRSVP